MIDKFIHQLFSKAGLLIALLGISPWISSLSWAADDDVITAVIRNNPQQITYWLAQGSSPNALHQQGRSALAHAIYIESWQAAEALLSAKDLDVNARSPQGETALMLAAIKGRLDWVQRLIALQANVNQPGWTALHYAASVDLPDTLAIMQLLLEAHYAYIDAASPNGTTALMLAAQYSSQAVVDYLLEQGADIHLRNEQGLSVIDFAQRSQRAYMVAHIEQRWQSIARHQPPSW
ncbi:MAG: ankyrin repeat domain-containing protein [Comamonas sp.]|nr:ankyrin repeat domain-containing protein [Comamonas sp.]